MAGDWIKIRTDLPSDPSVMRLSDILGTDDPTTVGHLVAFWAWADKQTTDGIDIAITSARLDRLIGRQGFAEAMRQIGWLSGRDGSLSLPRFERHNGNSAKARPMDAEAKRLRRLDQNGLSDKLSDTCPTKNTGNVRPEKRREEKSKIPPDPQGGKQGESGNLPTSPQAIRIANLYRRKITTPWSPKEIKAFKSLSPIDPEELDLVCRYEESEMAKGDLGWHKRDLATFLNHFVTELDRARAWEAKPSGQLVKKPNSVQDMGIS